ncbi:hypothetical protein [Pseudomonas shirazensis]|uniref:hypothetical protein n=1 Tax=Pseudomonas shirazensis TaxID=2745494 RepID=UPI003D2E8D5C
MTTAPASVQLDSNRIAIGLPDQPIECLSAEYLESSSIGLPGPGFFGPFRGQLGMRNAYNPAPPYSSQNNGTFFIFCCLQTLFQIIGQVAFDCYVRWRKASEYVG